MSIGKSIKFIQEVGSIMYVGGILSHIVIGNVLGHADPGVAYNVYIYKMYSAYILILPGLALKVVCDLIDFYRFKPTPNWLKVKLLCMAFLAINAFVFLVPMMPELVQLAQESLPTGEISQAFLEKAHVEQLVGMSNVIPLLTEMVVGSFQPRLGKELKKNK